MTRAEALDLLKDRAFMMCAVDLCDMDCQDCHKALYMAIEALEQEPSEDCISRADLLNKINAYLTGSQQVSYIKRIIEDAPSVVPAFNSVDCCAGCKREYKCAKECGKCCRAYADNYERRARKNERDKNEPNS